MLITAVQTVWEFQRVHAFNGRFHTLYYPHGVDVSVDFLDADTEEEVAQWQQWEGYLCGNGYAPLVDRTLSDLAQCWQHCRTYAERTHLLQNLADRCLELGQDVAACTLRRAADAPELR